MPESPIPTMLAQAFPPSPSPRLLLSLVLALGLTACGEKAQEDDAAPASEIAEKRRSVLLVTLDTTRPDRLEPYGADDVETPTLRRLASRGILFERAWAVAPITLVSHTSILSGLYPFEHGVRNNGMQYVPESVTTLAERLTQRALTPADLAAFAREAPKRLPTRLSYRRKPSRKGTRLDMRRTLREAVRRDGEVLTLKETRRQSRQRRLV
ncbi:MAG: alkaline phosphatase family protein, partial [Acidobacteriota bacterium]